MISVIFGDIGTGKSFTAVSAIILPALKAGRKVVTNIPLNLDALSEYAGNINQLQKTATMDDISLMLLSLNGDEIISGAWAGAVFVLDEFSLLLPAGTKDVNISKRNKLFFSMSRHFTDGANSTEIVLLAQSPTQIASYVRNLVAQSTELIRADFGNTPLITSIIYRKCPLTKTEKKDCELERSTKSGYDKDYFKYYRSQTMSDSVVSEKSINGKTNLLKSKAFLSFVASLAIFPLLAYWAFSSSVSLFDEETISPAAHAQKSDLGSIVAKSPVLKSPPVSVPAKPAPIQPVQSSETLGQSFSKLGGQASRIQSDLKPSKFSDDENDPFAGAVFYLFGTVEARGKTTYLLSFVDADGGHHRVDAADLSVYGYSIRKHGTVLMLAKRGVSRVLTYRKLTEPERKNDSAL